MSVPPFGGGRRESRVFLAISKTKFIEPFKGTFGRCMFCFCFFTFFLVSETNKNVMIYAITVPCNSTVGVLISFFRLHSVCFAYSLEKSITKNL